MKLAHLTADHSHKERPLRNLLERERVPIVISNLHTPVLTSNTLSTEHFQ